MTEGYNLKLVDFAKKPKKDLARLIYVYPGPGTEVRHTFLTWRNLLIWTATKSLTTAFKLKLTYSKW